MDMWWYLPVGLSAHFEPLVIAPQSGAALFPRTSSSFLTAEVNDGSRHVKDKLRHFDCLKTTRRGKWVKMWDPESQLSSGIPGF